MLLLGSSLALASTDDLGGNGVEEVSTGMMKLVSIEVEEASVVTTLEFAVSGSSVQNVVLALYQRDDRGYVLVASRDAEAITGGYATSGTLEWLLEPGESYALGAYVGSGYTLFYDEGGSASPWFGAVGEGFQAAGVVPNAFSGVGEARFYQMRVTSEDADFDGDGVISTLWGGTDCDDSDPDLIYALEEIPYDGLDQDCDGRDLVDVDDDGHAAVEAGGTDCDDATEEINPSAVDVCGDRLDSDCSGADAVCPTVGPPKHKVDDGVGVAGGCAVPTSSPGSVGVGLLALVLSRRALPSPRAARPRTPPSR